MSLSFLLYTTGIFAVGIYSARFSRRTSSDFFLADRGLGPWVAALSSSASAESGWVTLGLVGTAFNTGVGALWIVPGTVAAFVFNWLVLAPRLRRAAVQHGGLTIGDVLGQPYTGTPRTVIRVLSVLIILTMLTAYVAAQLNAAGKTFMGTFDWSYTAGVLCGAAIVLGYTITGGFRAVAWTDVVQAILMVTAVLVLPLVMVVHLGGFAELFDRLNAVDPNLTGTVAGKAGLSLIGFLAVWLGIPLGNPGQPHILVRLMAVRDEVAIRRGAIISSVWVFLLFTVAILSKDQPKIQQGTAKRRTSETAADPCRRVGRTLQTDLYHRLRHDLRPIPGVSEHVGREAAFAGVVAASRLVVTWRDLRDAGLPARLYMGSPYNAIWVIWCHEDYHRYSR